MIIDFQQHYTPAEMLKGDPKSLTAQVDERGNPNYLLNPQLGDLNNHVRMMDHAGIDMGVLSCGVGFDQPDLKFCRAINDRMAQAEKDHPGRFIGLAHVPAMKPDEAEAEFKRCAVDLGFPGVVIASEMQDQALDHESLRPFWKACCDLGLYVFIHPLAKVINWNRMDADDLGRMFGWEFSLMIATIRVINSGLLDDLPDLKIHFSHFSGGIGRYRGRYNGFQQRTKWGTSQIKGHNRQPKLPVDHYLNNRLYLRLRRLGRPRSVRAARRRLGEVRPAGAGAVAMRVRHRLSAGDPRSGRGQGLCRGGRGARSQRQRAGARAQRREAHPEHQGAGGEAQEVGYRFSHAGAVDTSMPSRRRW